MTNQKIYSIKIDGLEKSIGEVDILTAQLDELEKKLNKLSKSKVDVDVKSSKEIAENTKLQTDEYKKQIVEKEKIKKVNDEIKKQQKEIAIGVRDTNGEYTNTLAGQRAYLAEIKKQLSTTDLNSDEWVVLRDRVAEVNESVKQLEQSYGVFTRNVGNYQDAANGFASIKTEVDETNDALETLRNNAKIKVDVAGATVEFETLSQAIGEIDDMAQKAAAEMQMLAAAGQENTDAYKKAAATFSEYVQAAGELEKARKYADGIKESFASQTRALDTTVQSFQAIVGSMQVASGVAGIFGADQEKLNEAMNRTIQLMGIAQGLQETYNKVLGEGGLIAQLNAKRTQAQTVATQAQTVATKGATVATKTLGKAFKAIGIGLIVSAVASLVANWKDIVKWFDKSGKAAETLGNVFNKLKQVFMGIGNVIITYVKGPVEALINIFKGDFKGALDDITSMFQVKKNYLEGETREVERQAEKQLEKKQELFDKEKDEYIKLQEAKNGSDWKFTKEAKATYDKYYKNKLAMYKKDSDEYKEALLAQINYEREYNEKQKELADKRRKNAEDAAKKSKESNKKTLIGNIEYDASKYENYAKNVQSALDRVSLRLKQEENELNNISDVYNELFDITLSKRIKTPLGTLNDDAKKVYKNLEYNLNTISDAYTKFVEKFDTISKNKLTTATKLLETELNKSMIELAATYNQQLSSLLTSEINDDINVSKISGMTKQLETFFQAAIDENETLMNAARIEYAKYVEQVNNGTIKLTEAEQRAFEKRQQIFSNFIRQEQADTLDYFNNLQNAETDHQRETNAIRLKGFESIVKQYKQQYDELMSLHEQYVNSVNTGDSDLDVIFKNASSNSFFKKFEGSFNQLSANIKTTIDTIEAEIIMLDAKITEVYNGTDAFIDGELSESAQAVVAAIEAEIQKLLELQNQLGQTGNSVKKASENGKNSDFLPQWVNSTLASLNYLTNSFSSFYSQLADMQLNNLQKEIEELEEAYDKEEEILDKHLSEQEDLVARYNDNINSLEDELENSRGSRRTFILNQIAKETQAREEAFLTQKAIEKEKEKLEQKREALAKKEDEAQKKRNRQQKAIDLMMAASNTAMAITNALKTPPAPLGIALASLVGAMGAAQIGIIAATKYADGGVLQGNSHAAGGIKILGGTAEVEGGEYITNKRTTAQNVDLLSFINSKKKKLNLDDFVEFYSGNKRFNNVNFKNRFETGGQLPKNINTQREVYVNDNRPIVVSVVEIENVSNKVRQAKALAGL